MDRCGAGSCVGIVLCAIAKDELPLNTGLIEGT